MGRWLRKVQQAQDRAPTQPTKPGSVSSVSSLPGAFAKNDPLLAGDPPGPAHEIDTIIDVLARQVGRPLGEELALQMRQAMRQMSRQARAELAAGIDDCFEHAESAQAGRQQAETLVRQAIPEDKGPASLSDALSWIGNRCELARDDRQFLGRHFAPLPQADMTEMAERYVVTWLAAADEEPNAQRRDNAGRGAANSMLRGATS